MAFEAGTGLMGATMSGQRVTKENVRELPCGSVIRLDDSDGVLIHLAHLLGIPVHRNRLFFYW